MADYFRDIFEHPGGLEWFQIIDLLPSVGTSTFFVVKNLDGTLTAGVGTDFEYDAAGVLTKGTIEELRHANDDTAEIYAELEGLNVAVEDFVAAASPVATSGFAMSSLLLSGDDTFDHQLSTPDPTDPYGRTELWLGEGADTVTRLGNNVLVHMVGGNDHIDIGGSPAASELWASYRFNTDGSNFTPVDPFALYDLTITLNSIPGIESSWNAAGSAIGGGENDILEAITHVEGSYGDDLIRAYSWNDLTPPPGINDSDVGSIVFGYDGNDRIDSAQTAFGGDGDDILTQMVSGTYNGFFAPYTGSDLHGGNGNDTFEISAAGYSPTKQVLHSLYGDAGTDEVVIQYSGGGVAGTTVVVDLTNALPSNIADNLMYVFESIEDVTGGGAVDLIYGTSGANVLKGNGNDDNIYGQGGADTLEGGNGHDILDGGSGADIIRGGIGNDWISGGFQADDMDGGDGIDTVDYTYSNADLTVDLSTERAYLTADGPPGTEIVANFENVNMGGGGDTVIGNALNNVLDGGAGQDRLDGGTGIDTLVGGTGNDIYFVDEQNDIVVENAGEGTDFIFSTSSYQIAAGAERLLAVEGATAYGLTARNFQNDIIIGNSGTNVFVDQFGRDIFVGGGGADYFRFIANLDPVNNVNRINDFNSVDDQFQLLQLIYTEIDVGILDASKFVLGTAATDADDRIIYDSTAGVLYYDPDGTGATAQIEIVNVTAGITITADDFQIY